MGMFKKATRKNVRLRAALDGVTGSGKTFTALRIAHALCKLRGGGKIAFLDSDRMDDDESAHIYAGEKSPDGGEFDFDVVHIADNAPRNYIKILQAAADEGYTVAIIDSLSKPWEGEGGALQMVDEAAKRSRSGNSFTAWRDVTPEHNALISAILTSPMDIIATLRSKSDWVIEENEKGKKAPRKVGLKSIQRDGVEYEFDLVVNMDDKVGTVSKTRFSNLQPVYRDVGENIALDILARLNDGVPAAPAKSTPVLNLASPSDGHLPDDSPPADEPAPKSKPKPAASDDHDPSFDENERKKFMAYLGELGFKYDEAKQICAAKGLPKPSTLDQARRNKCALWLRDLAWERDEPDVESQLKRIGMTIEDVDKARGFADLPPLAHLTTLGRAEAVNELITAKSKSAASAAK